MRETNGCAGDAHLGDGTVGGKEQGEDNWRS